VQLLLPSNFITPSQFDCILKFECILIEGEFQQELIDLKATAVRYSIQTKDLHHFAHATMGEEHVYAEFARRKPYN
jgi:hypothetical protein